jgi:hypothetical protein
MSGLAIVSICSLCRHRYSRMWDAEEMEEHMARAHGMRFVPGNIRKGIPPRWIKEERRDEPADRPQAR